MQGGSRRLPVKGASGMERKVPLGQGEVSLRVGGRLRKVIASTVGGITKQLDQFPFLPRG